MILYAFKNLYLYFYFMYLSILFVNMCVYYKCAVPEKGQKIALDALKLESQMLVKHNCVGTGNWI